MHYTAIAKAAIKLRLLRTESPNVEIMMSSVISADISANKQSRFQREKAGVYSLRSEIGEKLPIFQLDVDGTRALLALRRAFPTNSDAAIVRRATYFYGRLIELSAKKEKAALEGGKGRLEIDPRDTLEIRALSARAGREEKKKGVESEKIATPILKNDPVVKKIVAEILHLDWIEVVSLALVLLNCASAICASQGRVKILGSRGSTTILVMSDGGK